VVEPGAAEFSNRLALVAGAAQGIGRAIAQGFVERGATVHLLDIDEGTTRWTCRIALV
jgi:NAD(P)-dependent dehydrogenase (short-subunit alcohol dehydrogenase family)